MTGDRRPGYRGSLPPRGDWLGAAWALTVVGVFVAIMVMAALGLPSSLFPEPTPTPFSPVPSILISPSPEG